MSESRSFDIGTPVIIQNLVKGAQYNGKCGFVVSPYNSASGRQNVFIKDANKTIAIKPINMKIDTKTRDLHEKLGADRKDKNKTPDLPGWYRDKVTPNDGNQYTVQSGINRKRKPDVSARMLGIGSEKYWQGGGKYQKLFDELVNSLPPAGNSSTTAGEIVRAANKLMYDLYNNGMMNNTSSALLFLARKGVFPTAGGDKVFATIYPYSLGPSGNTPYHGDQWGENGRYDDLTKSIERMVDKSCKFIVDNPHLKTEANRDDMSFGFGMIQLGTQVMNKKELGEDYYKKELAEDNISEFWLNSLRMVMKQGNTHDSDYWYNALFKLQLAMEGDDNGGCNHGRPPLTIMGKNGFEFVDYCVTVWEDTNPTLVNFKSFLSSTLSLGKFSNLFQDADKMKLVKAYLKASATSLYLGGKIDAAAGVVSCIILLEDLTGFNESELKKLVVTDEAGDSRENNIVTFLSAQSPCSCLDQSKQRALCNYCKKTERSNLLQQCSACFGVSYCSKQCQRADWKNHRKVCRRTASKKKE